MTMVLGPDGKKGRAKKKDSAPVAAAEPVAEAAPAASATGTEATPAPAPVAAVQPLPSVVVPHVGREESLAVPMTSVASRLRPPADTVPVARPAARPAGPRLSIGRLSVQVVPAAPPAPSPPLGRAAPSAPRPGPTSAAPSARFGLGQL